ncbi:MAG TPA: ROK family transcriptional regulator, partial [Trueperaceae bacterium]
MARTSPTALGRDHIRALNQRAVIDAIHQHARISRSELAAELRLSPAAVTAITATFIREGLIYEAEQGNSNTVGRKPILLGINYDYAFVYGIKVSNAAITTALANLNSEVLACRSDPLHAHDLHSVLDAIETSTARLLRDSRIPEDKIIGLGVNLPGIVEPGNGIVRHSPLLGWSGVPFATTLQERLRVPVLVENDVNALAAAEAWFGYGRQHDSFLVLTLGRGIGLGIVIDGKVYRGPHGGAGEFGHATLRPLNAPHQASGTLESFLSDAALLDHAHQKIPGFPEDATPEDLTELAAQGNPDALALLREAGELLGLALSYLIDIFAPALIILSGEGVRNAPYLLPHTRSALAEHSFGDLAQQTRL